MKKTLFIALFFCLTGFTQSLQAQQLTIYQYWNSTIHRHFYTTDPNELGSGKDGWVQQRVIGGLDATGNPNITTGAYSRAVYRFYNTATATHYYAIDATAPSGFHLEGIIGYTPHGGALLVPIYEFYNSGDYYYSTDPTIPDGYVAKGMVFYAY